MKFGEYLRMHLTPEWCSQYISYEEMKDMFTETIKKIPSLSTNNPNFSREEYFRLVDNEFFQLCERECTRINTFFIEKLAEALLRFDLLKSELESIEISHQSRHLTIGNVLYTKRMETNVNEDVNSITYVNDDDNNNSQMNILPLKQSISNGQLKRHRYRKHNDLKLALSEFYLMLILLKDYQTLNYTGFRKILKKHDKLFETARGEQWRRLYIDSAPFHTSTQVDQLMNEVEDLYTNKLESGDRTRAMQRLRLPPLEEKQPRTVTFRLGMFIGMICLLIPILIILGIALFGKHSSQSINWRAAFHLYRSSFFVIMHLIFVGINVYGWSTSGVNHVLIFEIDPRNHLTYQRYLELGTFLMTSWLISFNIFLITFYLNFYPYVQPFAFVIFLILFVINPLPIFYQKARWWFVKRLFRIFLAPFYPVEFADFWLGDQLCSLELVFFDLEFFICFYINESNWSTSDPTHTFFCNGWAQICLQIFFLMLPSWFRFVQCLRRYRDTKKKFPHLVNAGKYASSFFVIISNALRRATAFDYHHNKLENPFLYVWIVTALISSTYKVIWDLKMDLGFFQKNTGENRFLREQIIYSKKYYYYLATVENIIFRYIWMIHIFIHFNTLFGEFSDLVGFLFGFIEIFRRFIWNFFRLENEHLNNCGEFRAVRDISIRPTSFDIDPFNPEQPLRHDTERSESNSSEDGVPTSVTTTTELTNNRSKSIPNLRLPFGNSPESIHS